MGKLFDPQAWSPDNFELDRQRHLGTKQDAQDADDPQAGSPDNFELDRQRHLGVEQDTQDSDDTQSNSGADSSAPQQPSVQQPQRLSNYAEMEDFLRKQMQDIKVETPKEQHVSGARSRRAFLRGLLMA